MVLIASYPGSSPCRKPPFSTWRGAWVWGYGIDPTHALLTWYSTTNGWQGKGLLRSGLEPELSEICYLQMSKDSRSNPYFNVLWPNTFNVILCNILSTSTFCHLFLFTSCQVYSKNVCSPTKVPSWQKSWAKLASCSMCCYVNPTLWAIEHTAQILLTH